MKYFLLIAIIIALLWILSIAWTNRRNASSDSGGCGGRDSGSGDSGASSFVSGCDTSGGGCDGGGGGD